MFFNLILDFVCAMIYFKGVDEIKLFQGVVMGIKVYSVGMSTGERTIVAESIKDVLYAIQNNVSLHHRYEVNASDANGGTIHYHSLTGGHDCVYHIDANKWFKNVELFNKVLLDTRTVQLKDLHKVFGNYREVLYNVYTQGKFETDNYIVFNKDVQKWKI